MEQENFVPLHQLEFLSFGDEYGDISESDRQILYSVAKFEDCRQQPGEVGFVWTTPPPEEDVIIEFGCASEVFNSITSGNFNASLAASTASLSPPSLALPPPVQGLSYTPVVPQPGTPQHIHINNYTANLTYHATGPSSTTSEPSSRPDSIGPAPIPRQPVPFANYPLNYVAPFPQTSPSPPVFASAPFPQMMIYHNGTPLHFSMYSQAQGQHPYHANINPPRDHKLEAGNLMFGSTPVVSVKHSSSDDEQDDTKEQIEPDTLPLVAVKHEIKPLHNSAPDVPVHGEINCAVEANESPNINHDVEVEGLCLSIDHVNPKEIEKVCDKGPPLPRPLEDDVSIGHIHRPTPPPFPLINTSRSGSIPNDITSDNEESKSGPKSWASLFNNTDPSAERIQVDKPMARIPPFSTKQEDSPIIANSHSSQEFKHLGEHLKRYHLKHVAPSFLPRGLTNRSNWCFVNAILQALLACPPFYNLIKDLPNVIGFKSGKSATPMMDSLSEFVNEYIPLEAMNKNQKRDKGRKREDLPVGNAFEPTYVYKVLLESNTFKVEEGRQEDAEEFLTYLLNKLDDEMRGLIKITQQDQSGPVDSMNGSSVLDGEWKEMNAGGRCVVTRRVRDLATSTNTPIQMLVSGLIRSSVRLQNSEASATLQPFFTLQLDIQANSVNSVEDALLQNFTSEKIDGYICPKSRQITEASRTLSLEELPPILILHLKRMVYDGTTGGCQKVMKEVTFPVDLDINKEILSVNSKTRYTLKQRQYKLFGVVYHNGLEATKGHYVADVYHTGYVSWLRCDDSTVKATLEENVVTSSTGSAPYILFYRRCDTLVGVDKSK